MKAKVFKSKNTQQYSIDAPDGTEGDTFEYGETAIVVDEEGEIYLCTMDGPNDTPQIERVTETKVVHCEVEEIEFADDEEDEDESDDEPGNEPEPADALTH